MSGLKKCRRSRRYESDLFAASAVGDCGQLHTPSRMHSGHRQVSLLLGTSLVRSKKLSPPARPQLVSSMSRHGNCHDTAVAESFFQLLKGDRIRRQIHSTWQAARSEVCNYIEIFYNPKHRHKTAGNVSPVESEKRYSQRLGSV
jgi:hypothetical protein